MKTGFGGRTKFDGAHLETHASSHAMSFMLFLSAAEARLSSDSYEVMMLKQIYAEEDAIYPK